MFLFVLGAGLSCWLSKPYKNQIAYFFALSPLLGYALLAVLSVYPLAADLPTNHWLTMVFNILLICSISLVSAYLFFFREQCLTFRVKLAVPVFVILIVGVLWACLNNFENGFFYHHLNPDITGFTTSANWIGEHGNVFATTPEPHELLVAALRWGLPASLAITKLMLHTSVYAIIFPFVLIIFFHAALLVSLLLTDKYQEKWLTTGQFIAMGILLNGSLLYFLSEGFYPYLIGVGYFSVIVALSQYYAHHARVHYQSLAIVALSVATALVTCSELFCLSGVFLLGVLLIDMIKKNTLKIDLLFLVALCCGVLIAYPLSQKMAKFVIANSANASHIGYLQPTWLWFSDIIGLTNIYSHAQRYLDNDVATHLMSRSWMSVIMGCALSLWSFSELWTWRKNTHVAVMLLGIGGLLVTNIILVLFTAYSPYNYLYSKLAIAFSPNLIALFLIKIQQNRNSYLLKTSIAMTCILLSSALFLKDQTYSRAYIDIHALNQINQKFKPLNCFFISDLRGLRGGHMVSNLRYIDRTRDILMSAFLEGRLLDSWVIETHVQDAKKLSRTILLITDKTHFSKIFSQTNPPIFETRSYYVFDTNTFFSEFTPLKLQEIYSQTYQK